jgi:spore coat polysaccharide biosynthesis protein SpsF
LKTLVVVQARTGSTRLPGKVMLPVAGAPLIVRLLDRVLAARSVYDLVVATTERDEDDPLAELVKRAGVPVFRGHATDLLDRHYRAALAAGADAVVKIPSDCPLIDPAAIDRVIGAFLARHDLDYASNLHPASWPDGNDVEIMSFAALEQAWREASAPHEREHTTPFLWDQPERFRVANVRWEKGLDYSLSHRFTLDYPDDYAFVAAVYAALWRRERPVFTLADILKLLDVRPELRERNARYAGVNWYRHHTGVLRHVQASETRLPPEELAAGAANQPEVGR